MNVGGARHQLNVGGARHQLNVGGARHQLNVGGARHQLNVGGARHQLNVGGARHQLNVGGVKHQLNTFTFDFLKSGGYIILWLRIGRKKRRHVRMQPTSASDLASIACHLPGQPST